MILRSLALTLSMLSQTMTTWGTATAGLRLARNCRLVRPSGQHPLSSRACDEGSLDRTFEVHVFRGLRRLSGRRRGVALGSLPPGAAAHPRRSGAGSPCGSGDLEPGRVRDAPARVPWHRTVPAYARGTPPPSARLDRHT